MARGLGSIVLASTYGLYTFKNTNFFVNLVASKTLGQLKYFDIHVDYERR